MSDPSLDEPLSSRSPVDGEPQNSARLQRNLREFEAAEAGDSVAGTACAALRNIAVGEG